ncbi:MAG: hypothetical protein M1827_001380 [Pycnora praestabilis]|nr:MAG: hypothetical protein M1827_001380 [Pycnora praestabilis]
MQLTISLIVSALAASTCILAVPVLERRGPQPFGLDKYHHPKASYTWKPYSYSAPSWPTGTGAPFPTGTGAPFPSGTGAPFPTGSGGPFPIGTGAPYPTGTGAPFPTDPKATAGPWPTLSYGYSGGW